MSCTGDIDFDKKQSATTTMDQFMNRLSEKHELMSDCKLNDGNPKTIILMGRTRSGKSTIAKVLENPLYIPPTLNLYSKTKQIEKVRIGSFHIIDLPGFFDRTSSSNREQHLSNETINKLLDEYLEELKQVHLFGLVFSLTSGINDEDIQSMLLVMKKYQRFSRNFALIITHCELTSQEERVRLTTQFFSNDDVTKYKIQKFFKQDVLFMGCCQHESFMEKDRQAVECQYENILEMRKEFIEKCRNCSPIDARHSSCFCRCVCCS